jgi:PTH1 family peptidyl-tRNA hydrolase
VLFVGLGNPEKRYEKTRHNIGFRVIDYILENSNPINLSKSSFFGELYKIGKDFYLKPTTYMNLSGKSVLAVKNFYKIDNSQIVVIHDDIDLPFSALRFKRGGGNGGHNGLKSIDSLIGKDYIRVRMGVGKPEHKSQVPNYVLSNFSEDEERVIPDWVEYTAKVLEKFETKSLEEIKSRYSLKEFKKE